MRNRLTRNPLTGQTCTLTFQIPFATLEFSSLDALSVKTTAGGNNTGGQLYVWPTNSFYMPTTVYNQIRNWNKYRIIKHRLRFTTRFGSAVNSTITCAHFKDPCGFEALGLAGTAIVTEANLQYNHCCVRWPVWKNMMCRDYPGTGWKMVAGPRLSTAFNTTDSAANDRMCVDSVYGITCDRNPTPGTGCIVGDIYLDFVIQVKDMQSVPAGDVSYYELQFDIMKKKMEKLRLEAKMKEHDRAISHLQEVSLKALPRELKAKIRVEDDDEKSDTTDKRSRSADALRKRKEVVKHSDDDEDYYSGIKQ
jgi:hypothetical protein